MDYNKSLVPFARRLRKGQTRAEQLLWKRLRARQLINHKFRRQFPIGNAILDFYCEEKRLGIEVDGSQHLTRQGINRDKQRTHKLEGRGIVIMRFLDTEVLQNVDGILERIQEKLITSPTSSPQGEGK